jgi:hypothetical protein
LFYRGELHLLRGELEQAERDISAAHAKAKRRDDAYMLRNGLIRVKIKTGKVAELYRELGPSRENFQDLGFACLNDKNAGQLDALIAARRQDNGDDQDLTAWGLDSLWLKKEYKQAVDLIQKHRDGLFDQPRYRDKGDNYLVRGLVKLGRPGDAVKEAEALFKSKRITSVLLVLAHASTGDVAQTVAVVERLVNERFVVANCYRDEDLGPILRGEPFAPFRARFPEPALTTKGKD